MQTVDKIELLKIHNRRGLARFACYNTIGDALDEAQKVESGWYSIVSDRANKKFYVCRGEKIECFTAL